MISSGRGFRVAQGPDCMRNSLMRRISSRPGHGASTVSTTFRYRHLAACVVLLCLVLAGGGSALAVAAVTPPPGTPDLSQMVLQRSDFSRAGPLMQDGYTRPGFASEVASYVRVFGPSSLGRTRFASVESDALVLTDAATATVLAHLLQSSVKTLPGRQGLLQPLIQGFNQGAHRRLLRFRDFHFRPVQGVRAGDGSFVLTAWFVVKGHKISLDIFFVRVDRAIGSLWLLAAGNIRAADAAALAQATAGHMRSALTMAAGGTPTHP